jgi:hypothetical protein
MKNWQWFIFWMFWLLSLLGGFALSVFHPDYNPTLFAQIWCGVGLIAGFGWFIQFLND